LTEEEDRNATRGLTIAISGLHGSGRTTHAKRLAESLGLRYLSSGMIFRQVANERSLSLEEMSRIAENDPEFDNLIDKRAKEESVRGGVVVDATLAGWMVENPDISIFLTTPFSARVNRIAMRENLSLEEAERETRTREDSERQRFMRYYGMDINDLSIYDVVLNTELFSPNGTARILKKIVDEYCSGCSENIGDGCR
jgi:cytidylate kinase